MKEAVKKISKLIGAGDQVGAAKLLPTVYQAIDKAKKRGVIKANAAARQKSRLAKMLVKQS